MRKLAVGFIALITLCLLAAGLYLTMPPQQFTQRQLNEAKALCSIAAVTVYEILYPNVAAQTEFPGLNKALELEPEKLHELMRRLPSEHRTIDKRTLFMRDWTPAFPRYGSPWALEYECTVQVDHQSSSGWTMQKLSMQGKTWHYRKGEWVPIELQRRR